MIEVLVIEMPILALTKQNRLEYCIVAEIDQDCMLNVVLIRYDGELTFAWKLTENGQFNLSQWAELGYNKKLEKVKERERKAK